MNGSRTRFIGREHELSSVLRLLDDGRLITITGPGGVGKTRLVFEAAREWGRRTQGAVRVCELAEHTHPESVAPAVAAALGCASLDQLLRRPGERELLVLDNCEHLLAASAAAVAAVIESPADVRVLVTSREALGVDGERLLLLDPLAVPAGSSLEAAQQSPAVALFVDRARDQGVALTLDDGSAVVLLSLCRRLDGLPLALELAASRMRSMTAEDILARLDDRLRVLVRRKRADSGRHHALRATIDWSYEMLQPAEQKIFERLGVFPAELDEEAVRFVSSGLELQAEDALDVLDGLVDRSLLVARPRAGAMRYIMLESLSEYAIEKLRERGELVEAHERFVGYMFERYEKMLETGKRTWPAALLAALFADFANLRAAIHWCLEQDEGPDRAFVLTAVLSAIPPQTNGAEIAELSEQVRRRWPDQSHPMWSFVTGTVATGHLAGGSPEKARAAAMEGLPNPEKNPMGAIVCRRALAILELYEGNLDEARRWIDDAIEIAEAFAPQRCELLIHKARIIAQAGFPDQAIPFAEEAHELAERLDIPHMAAGSDAVAGWLHLFTSPAIARARFEHAIDTAARLHFPQVIGTSYLGLAMVTALEDERARAARFFGEALDHWEQIGDRPQTWSALRWVGFWLARWGRPSAAARLLAAVEARPDAPVLTDLEKALFDEVDASLREELEEVDEARAEGSVWSRRHALRAARRELSKVVQDVEQSSAIESAEPRDTERDASGGRSIFRRDGELWALSFDGRSALIRDLKGLHDIALLLSQPEREVHCLDLADRTESGSSDAPVLDARARREYEKRIQDLQDDLAEAEAHNDYGRAEKAGAELDALTEQLAAAFGLGGRERGLGSSVERARSAVTWRIRSAIKKIEGVHEPLGKHLRASIQTGVYVAYSPPAPVDWEL